MNKENLSNMELDTIAEIFNISFGSAATAISTLLDNKTMIVCPTIREFDFDKLNIDYEEEVLIVEIEYSEGILGSTYIALKKEDVVTIVSKMMDMDINDDYKIDEMFIAAIGELMYQAMGASVQVLSCFLGKTVDFLSPENTSAIFGTFESCKNEVLDSESKFVVIDFDFEVVGCLDSKLWYILPSTLSHEIMNASLQIHEDEKEEEYPHKLETKQIDDLLNSLTNPVPEKLSPEEQEKRDKEKEKFRNWSRILESINLKRAFRKCLPLSGEIDVELVHIEQQRMSEFINALPDEPINIIKINPLNGHLIVDFPKSLHEQIIRQNYIDCETIDINLTVKSIFKNIYDELLEIFKLIDDKTEFEISNIESKHSRYSAFPVDEIVIMSVFDVTIDDYMGCFVVVVPMCMLNKYEEKLSSENTFANWFYE